MTPETTIGRGALPETPGARVSVLFPRLTGPEIRNEFPVNPVVEAADTTLASAERAIDPESVAV